MYLERITLPSSSTEDEILYSSDSPIGTMKGLMKCHSGNLYPFGLFPERSGGNGSGKTTILNLIAESVKAMRHSAFNKSGLFYDYLQRQRRKFEVFNEQRSRFSDEMSRRRAVYKEEAELGKGVSVDFDDPESIESFHKRSAIMKNTNSMLIVKRMGIDQKGQSNGETAIDFFVDGLKTEAVTKIAHFFADVDADIDFFHNLHYFYPDSGSSICHLQTLLTSRDILIQVLRSTDRAVQKR